MSKRIMALFQPEAWIQDHAVSVDGAYTFDVTDQILKMTREEALLINDNDYDSDELWHEHPISTEKPHAGPFRIVVKDAITKYFEESS